MSHFISASTTVHLLSWLSDRLLLAVLFPVIVLLALMKGDPKQDRAIDSAARGV